MSIQFIRYTSSEWGGHQDDILKPGQPGIEYCDNGEIRMKVGNSSGDAWKDLPYIGFVPNSILGWKQVQAIVASGAAPSVFNIGDQLICYHSTFGELTFDIVGFDQEQIVDANKKHSMTLIVHDLLSTTFQFDAAEPNNPNSYRKSYGSNNWKYSNIRQWLNSSGTKGNWFSPTTSYDVAPNYATTYDGFMLGLDEDFKSVIGPVVKTTANTSIDGGGSYTTQDTIFLPSLTEMYGGLNNNISEGEAYIYFSENSSLSSAGDGNDSNRIKYRNNATYYYDLRSPNPASSYTLRLVGSRGNIGYTYPNYGNGIAIACAVIG